MSARPARGGAQRLLPWGAQFREQELTRVSQAVRLHGDFGLLQEVGYSPGLNQVAALLLIFLDEEDAFWALAQLMANDRHAMQGRCWLDQAPAARLRAATTVGSLAAPHLGVHNILPLESLNVGLGVPHTA